VIGVILALAVIAIVVSLLGGWIIGIVIGAVAIVLLVLFLAGWGRGAAARTPDTPG
jgi:hypothetical protein